jgi:hypothetical protein
MASLPATLAAASLHDEADERDAYDGAGGGEAESGGWDDSALVTAYEDAVRRYQQAHGLLPPGACTASLGSKPALRQR